MQILICLFARGTVGSAEVNDGEHVGVIGAEHFRSELKNLDR